MKTLGMTIAILSAGFSLTTAAMAEDCSSCNSSDQRYCGTYDYGQARWISGSWSSCASAPVTSCTWTAVSTEWVNGSLHGSGCIASTVGMYCAQHQVVVEVSSCTGQTQTVATDVERTCLVNGSEWNCRL